MTDSGIFPCKVDGNTVYVHPSANFVLVPSDEAGELTDTGKYTAAYLAIQRGDIDEALNVLGELGDVYFIDGLMNAFTNAEYGEVETEIKEAVFNDAYRFIHGQDTSHLPDPFAPCLLDALDLLIQDPNARMYPSHKSFVYKRTGRKTETVGDYPDFEYDNDVSFPISDLVWNKKRLNLSLRGKIAGHIKLGAGVKKHGFANPFPTFVWRTYTIIKDGIPNVSILPISCSEQTFNILQGYGMIDGSEQWEEGKINLLYTTAVPVMNRGMIDQVSAVKMTQMAFGEILYQAQAKVVKDILGKLTKDEEKVSEALTPEQNEFLAAHGITSNGFNPPTKQAATTDYYMAKTFEIKVSGFSSLPKISEVLERAGSGSTQTKAGDVLYAAIGEVMARIGHYTNDDCATEAFDLLTDKDTEVTCKQKLVNFLTEETTEINHRLAYYRSEMAQIKFAVLLGKKWFPELPSRDNPQFTSNGVTFTFAMGEEKVEI